MSYHGNFFLSYEDCAAYRALNACGETCGCAGCFYCGDFFLSVSYLFNRKCFYNSAAVVTDNILGAFFCAGSFFYNFVVSCGVRACNRNSCFNNAVYFICVKRGCVGSYCAVFVVKYDTESVIAGCCGSFECEVCNITVIVVNSGDVLGCEEENTGLETCVIKFDVGCCVSADNVC